ncbi:aldo-keto reductase family 1 member B1 [Rhipicephalus sanguineus]|uniref:aldo-keto reductase family 1 member B1 n=1 Tax=Rhipicephalus sanguineus TaxID=34632 RepID=UPI001894A0DA|nr:aldo-keto reductase family 1 member B1 [Rhipicephalus sanguineus]
MAANSVPTVTLSTGFKIPIIGLGTWQSDPGKVEEAVKIAIDTGYRHFDCALIYQNENEVGSAVSAKIADGTVSREDLWITSKLWCTYYTRARAVEGCQLSLKLLGLEYLDLYLMHWPFGYKDGDDFFPRDAAGEIIDSDVDYVEVWKGMEDCVAQGLVRSIGVCNFNKQQMDRLYESASIKPAVLQVECHPYLNQSELLSFCREHNMALTAYSPLGSPERPWANPDEPTLLEDPVIKSIAESHGKTSAQVLIRYQVERGVVVIPKSVTKERIIENFDIFDFNLTPEEMEAIDGCNKNFRYVPVTWSIKHKYYPFHETA